MMFRWMSAVFLILAADAGAAQEFRLDAPDSVGMRGGFAVEWAAEGGDGGVIEIRPEVDGRRVGYAYATKNPVPMEAPEATGEYVLVMVIGGEVRASAPLRVDPVTATLTAVPATDAGAAVEVAWAGPDNRGDQVTFAEAGGAPIRGASYAYTGNSKDGTLTLQAPQEAGRYDVVYLTGSTVLARHGIDVGGISASLTVAPQVTAGSDLEVAFEGPGNSGDLVTFAARDGEPIRPASYAYTANAPDGVAILRAFEETGPVDVVYLSGGRVIGRAPVEIVPVDMALEAAAEVPALQVFEVRWQGTGNGGDQVFMVAPGETTGPLYSYIDPLESWVALAAPEVPGAYELVYVTRGGRELARRAITVVPAPQKPGSLEVVQSPGAGFGPDDAVQVILDASGSMLQRQDGERRIEIAKRTLTELVTRTVPPGTGFALRVFGNREADACRTDLEIPLAPHDPGRAADVIASIDAVNLAKTPIAESIALSARDLAEATGARVLILLTDGEETCEGDPGRAIEALRTGGTDVRVNIVGYAIDDADLARTFEAWAAAGGGAYFDAADGTALGAALLRATAAPFRVLDGTGALVATGLAGDPAVTLPAGRYELRMAGRSIPVTVQPEELTQVRLD